MEQGPLPNNTMAKCGVSTLAGYFIVDQEKAGSVDHSIPSW